MYGLLQAGILAKNLLVHCLHNCGYYQVKRTSGLWRHVWRTISFKLLVEDFGIGYVGRYHADHLMSARNMYYENITTDWEGKLYCGITMKWNDTKRYADISTPIYSKESLHQFCHKTPIKPQHQIYSAPEWTYGADAQKMKPLDTSPELPTEIVKTIERIIGKLL